MNISIIGAGNVGTALAWSLQQADHQVRIGSRQPELVRAEIESALVANRIAPAQRSAFMERLMSIDKALEDAELILLAVPDNAIQDTAQHLFDDDSNRALQSGTIRSGTGTILAHCSGALTSAVLPTIAGIRHCSLHPLNSFPNRQQGLATLSTPQHGTALVCEGDASALAELEPVFSALGFHSQVIAEDSKPLYHAAAVLICNYLTVLMDAGLRTSALAGLDAKQFWLSVQPLITSTLSNLEGVSVDATGLSTSHKYLSGPIARGDVETVAKHLQLLNENAPEIAAIYQAMGSAALHLVEQRDDYPVEAARNLAAILSSKSND